MNFNNYQYDLQRPDTWVTHRAPELDPHLALALVNVGGLNLFGDARLRFVWGGTHREHPDGSTAENGEGVLKYFLCRTEKKSKGFIQYHGLFLPVIEHQEIGKPRWYVEQWQAPDETHPRGRYMFFFEVETPAGEYRAPDFDTIEWMRESLAMADERSREMDAMLKQISEDDDCETRERIEGKWTHSGTPSEVNEFPDAVWA